MIETRATHRNGSASTMDWTATALPRLESRIDRASAEFVANATAMWRQVGLLEERYETVQQGGGEEQMRRHRSRGKLPVRERVERLLDPDSAFLEFSALAAWDMYDNEAPS